MGGGAVSDKPKLTQNLLFILKFYRQLPFLEFLFASLFKPILLAREMPVAFWTWTRARIAGVFLSYQVQKHSVYRSVVLQYFWLAWLFS